MAAAAGADGTRQALGHCACEQSWAGVAGAEGKLKKGTFCYFTTTYTDVKEAGRRLGGLSLHYGLSSCPSPPQCLPLGACALPLFP